MRCNVIILAAIGIFLEACVAQPARVSVRFSATAITHMSARGLADKASHRRVTADDPVRIASISKLVTALGVMRMAELGQLDLDEDVSKQLGWPLRSPAAPDVPITLRMLLSHTSSLRDDVDYIVPLGNRLQDALGDPKAFDLAHPPGGYFKYANINFPVIASIMERTSGERFDRLMERLVFKPLALDACFNWVTCSDDAVARAVALYDVSGSVRKDDLRGARPPCPVAVSGACDLARWRAGENGAIFSPQGGVRISMLGLARIGQVLLREDATFLKPASYSLLRRVIWAYDGSNGDSEGGFYCRYGLAVQILASTAAGCHDDPVGDAAQRYGHAGEAYGLRSGLWIDPATRTGIAFFTSAIPDDAPKGAHSAFTAAEEAMLHE